MISGKWSKIDHSEMSREYYNVRSKLDILIKMAAERLSWYLNLDKVEYSRDQIGDVIL